MSETKDGILLGINSGCHLCSSLRFSISDAVIDNAGVLYVYDAENRLTQMTKGTTVANYRYDGLNRRISKEIGTAKTFYVHDGDEVVEERNATGSLVADYIYGPGIDEVLTMTRGANTYYYFYDALGSVRQITNAAGTISETYDYDVFGKPLNTSAVGNPVMFTGRWFDPKSGNFYYRARYYQPTLGRFLQRDPIGYGDHMNLMQYVGNNPINYVDPSGLTWKESMGLFTDWSSGRGVSTRYFGPESNQVKDLKDAPGIIELCTFNGSK